MNIDDVIEDQQYGNFLVITLIFIVYCFPLLQDTFTKDNRKTAGGKGTLFTDLGKPQYMLHDLFSEVRTGSQMCHKINFLIDSM
jgi:hypothetical protein